MVLTRFSKERKGRGRYSVYLQKLSEFVSHVSAAFARFPPPPHRLQKAKSFKSENIISLAKYDTGSDGGLLSLLSKHVENDGYDDGSSGEESYGDGDEEYDEELREHATGFFVGGKLEARDIQNPHLICVATVVDKNDTFIQIHFDGWTDRYDYWCRVDNPNIGPIGSSESIGIPLQSPKGFSGEFDWQSYLASTGSLEIPKDSFMAPTIGPHIQPHGCLSLDEFEIYKSSILSGENESNVGVGDWENGANENEGGCFGIWGVPEMIPPSGGLLKDSILDAPGEPEQGDSGESGESAGPAEVAGSSEVEQKEGEVAASPILPYTSLKTLYDANENDHFLQVLDVTKLEDTNQYVLVLSDSTSRTLVLLNPSCEVLVPNLRSSIIRITDRQFTVVNDITVVCVTVEIVMGFPSPDSLEFYVSTVGENKGNEESLKDAIRQVVSKEASPVRSNDEPQQEQESQKNEPSGEEQEPEKKQEPSGDGSQEAESSEGKEPKSEPQNIVISDVPAEPNAEVVQQSEKPSEDVAPIQAEPIADVGAAPQQPIGEVSELAAEPAKEAPVQDPQEASQPAQEVPAPQAASAEVPAAQEAAAQLVSAEVSAAQEPSADESAVADGIAQAKEESEIPPPPPPPASSSSSKVSSELKPPPAKAQEGPKEYKEGELPAGYSISPSSPAFVQDKNSKRIRLSNDRRVATLTGSGNGWAMVLVDKVLTHGVHYFETVLLSGKWGSTFYGVVPPDEYSPRACTGSGLINYRAVVRSGSNESHYGEHAFDGDTIGMLVNVDEGKLWFFHNGKNMGLAVTDLPSPLRPVYGMQNTGDSLQLRGEHLSIATIPVSTRLEDMSRLVELMKCFNSIDRPLPKPFLKRAYEKWQSWEKQETKVHRTKVEHDAVFDVRPSSFDKFGDFRYGDNVLVPSQSIFGGDPKEAVIVGVHGDRLWFQENNHCWYIDDPVELRQIKVYKREGHPYTSQVVLPPPPPTPKEEVSHDFVDETPSEPSLSDELMYQIGTLQEIFRDRPISQLREALESTGGNIEESVMILLTQEPPAFAPPPPSSSSSAPSSSSQSSDPAPPPVSSAASSPLTSILSSPSSSSSSSPSESPSPSPSPPLQSSSALSSSLPSPSPSPSTPIPPSSPLLSPSSADFSSLSPLPGSSSFFPEDPQHSYSPSYAPSSPQYTPSSPSSLNRSKSPALQPSPSSISESKYDQDGYEDDGQASQPTADQEDQFRKFILETRANFEEMFGVGFVDTLEGQQFMMEQFLQSQPQQNDGAQSGFSLDSDISDFPSMVDDQHQDNDSILDPGLPEHENDKGKDELVSEDPKSEKEEVVEEKEEEEEEEEEENDLEEDEVEGGKADFFYVLETELEEVSFDDFVGMVQSAAWDRTALENLVDLANSMTFSRPDNIGPNQLFAEVEKNPELFPGLDARAVGARFASHLLFTDILNSSLPLTYLSGARKYPYSIAAHLSNIRQLIFFWTKKDFWAQNVEETKQPHRSQEDEYIDPPSILTVPVERLKALRNLDSENGNKEATLFYQLYEKLASSASHTLRQQYSGMLDGGQKRCFRLQFKGEGVSDNGGPYRELFAQISDEVQSHVLPLFVHSQNFETSIGESRECWVPNPLQVSASDLNLYAFFGLILGVAHRGEIQMDLALSSIVWKTLAGIPLTVEDLKETDYSSYLALMAIEQLDEETFREYGDFVWTTANSGSKLPIEELRPGGQNVPVKFEELHEFVQANIEFRLSETSKQLESIRRGLSSIVPLDLLTLFTWEEVEELFCGKGHVNVDLLRGNTVYDGVDPKAKYIENFWRVLKSFSLEERKQFLKFVGSRSRLPASPADWALPFKIVAPQPRMKENPDRSFPYTQTCFFSLSLPEYTTYKSMRSSLLKAIQCIEMDADERVNDEDNRAWVE